MSDNAGTEQTANATTQTETASTQTRRVPRTAFKPGQSGNPAGMPKGTRHRATVMAEQLMAKDAKAIVQSVVDKAKGGDMVAARLVLDRIAPPRKGRLVEFDLPELNTPNDVVKALSAVIAATAKSELTPEEAAAVAGILEIKRRALETTELERRIATLEQGTQS